MYKTIDGNGRDFIRLCQTGELLVLDSLSWSGGPAPREAGGGGRTPRGGRVAGGPRGFRRRARLLGG